MVKRMFVAIDLPEDVRVGLVGLDPHLRGLRWLGASQLHLTLSFLGEVAAQPEQRLIAALAEIRGPRFRLVLQGLGSFSRNRQPAVVWAGVECAGPDLLRLQRRVCDAGLAAGLAAETKPYHPHVTVGRCKGLDAAALRPWLERHAQSDFGTFEVTGFTLYSSILHLDGPEYNCVFRQDLERV